MFVLQPSTLKDQGRGFNLVFSSTAPYLRKFKLHQPRLCCNRCWPSKLQLVHPLPSQRTPVPPAQSMRMMVSSIVRSTSVCSLPVQRHCTPSQSWRSETAQSITGRENQLVCWCLCVYSMYCIWVVVWWLSYRLSTVVVCCLLAIHHITLKFFFVIWQIGGFGKDCELKIPKTI